MSVESRFKKHLYKVCHNEDLREFALDFFHDLSARYEGKEFTRDEFASLVIDGKVVEQDVVLALFKNKDKVRAEEVFTYLFTQNIDRFGIKRKVRDLPDASGAVDALTKECIITRYRPRKVSRAFYAGVSTSLIDLWKQRKANKKQEKEQTRTHYKHIVYHEFSHIFELETYNNRELIRNEMSDKTFMKTKKGFVMFYGDDITRGLLNAIALGESYGLTAQSFVTILRAQGATAISEILNEEHAINVLNEDTVFNMLTADECNQRYIRKSRLSGSCAYNPNYDIASLVNLTLGDKRVRFNSCNAVYTLGNLNVSKDVLDEAKEKTMVTMEKDLVTDEDKARGVDIGVLLKDLDSYDTLALIMGVAGGYGYGMESPSGVTLEDYKVIAQGLLIESIKNDIIARLNDPMIYKGKDFYGEINKALETIDSVMCYPNTRTDFAYSRDNGKLLYADVMDVTTHVPARFAAKNPSMRNIVAFSELIDAVGRKLQEETSLEGIEEVMTFYQKQSEIEKKYQKNEEDSKFIEELHQEDLRIREEMKNRRAAVVNLDNGTRGV